MEGIGKGTSTLFFKSRRQATRILTNVKIFLNVQSLYTFLEKINQILQINLVTIFFVTTCDVDLLYCRRRKQNTFKISHIAS